ncbi:MAG: CBS domain-containing protein [Arcobacteraceae bacterium]|nr:CBS domain-containing protein [Arcobacteraceae bacterium]
MFAVYNNGSVQFRSTSDNLYNLDKVDELAQSRHKPDDDIYYSFDDILNRKHQNKQRENAIASYQEVSHLDTKERVYYVKDIMTKDFISIDSKDTVYNAYYLLKENQISQVPIVTFGNKIISMISKKTILNLILEDVKNGQLIMEKKLNEIFLPEVITTDPMCDIRKIAKVMIKYKIDAIPIVDKDNRLTGIVSKTDIIQAISHIPNFQLWA